MAPWLRYGRAMAIMWEPPPPQAVTTTPADVAWRLWLVQSLTRLAPRPDGIAAHATRAEPQRIKDAA
jgi:hypothetical protein